jgi:DNA-binding MarR family transcriptional regulator
MPSELSKELNLATSTVVEHLNKLEEADLIKREETGHKWIYYSLTDKGSALVRPRVPTNFIIILGLCILVVSVGFVYYYVNYATFTNVSPSTLTSSAQETAGGSKQATETRAPMPRNITNTTNTTNSTAP